MPQYRIELAKGRKIYSRTLSQEGEIKLAHIRINEDCISTFSIWSRRLIHTVQQTTLIFNYKTRNNFGTILTYFLSKIMKLSRKILQNAIKATDIR